MQCACQIDLAKCSNADDVHQVVKRIQFFLRTVRYYVYNAVSPLEL